MRKTAKEAVRQRKIYMVLIIILIIVLSVLDKRLLSAESEKSKRTEKCGTEQQQSDSGRSGTKQ